MTERERFEAWVVDTGLPDAMQADWLWECWQAALSGDVARDAARWQFWRQHFDLLCQMSVARPAGIDLSRTFVNSPEKMDAVTDAAIAKGAANG